MKLLNRWALRGGLAVAVVSALVVQFAQPGEAATAGSGLDWKKAAPAAAGETIYRDGTVDVSYRQLAAAEPQWSEVPRTFRDQVPEGSYLAQLQIKNVSTDDIDGWSLSFESPDRITAIESAKLGARQGMRTTIQNDPAAKQWQ